MESRTALFLPFVYGVFLTRYVLLWKAEIQLEPKYPPWFETTLAKNIRSKKKTHMDKIENLVDLLTISFFIILSA